VRNHRRVVPNLDLLRALHQTCKMNNVDPQAWLTDTLSRIAAGHKIGAITKLLPWA
jgi:hypothetical protein